MFEEIISFLASTLRSAIPLLIAGLGLLINMRAGVVNIGAEGIMLVGAFAGVVGSHFLGNAWYGMLFAGLSGAAFGWFFGFMTIKARSNETVVGTAFNILAAGLTTALSRVVFGLNVAPPQINSFLPVEIPLLSKIPLIGPVLFQQNVFTYLALLLVPICHFTLFKTKVGLDIRAVGENPKACDTVGISVYMIRYGVLVLSGLLCGIAGASVSIGLLSCFAENMIAGRGFIALAAVTFGKFKPIGILFAVLVFSAGEVLQYRLQASSVAIPYEFLLMLPYLLTILAVSGLVGKVRGPASIGKPYIRE